MAPKENRCPSCGAALADSNDCSACGPTAMRKGASKSSLFSRLLGKTTAPSTPTPTATDSLIGREIIGQFVVQKRLGHGGMGAVYLADQPSVGRKAVIKVLHEHLSADQDLVRRFHAEARAASSISHPNIVTIYNHGVLENGVLFLAMEYLEGTDLRAALEAGAFTEERALGILLQLADALGEAHRRGLIHRDLKPSNIMLISRGTQRDIAKILDFGIAKVEGVDVTATGLVCGTPRYMSPEQFLGKPLDGRSDLYSLGVVFYEMLLGQPPFESESFVGYMRAHVRADPPAPPRGKLAPAVEQLLLDLLAKDPADRPQTADATVQRIREAMRTPRTPDSVSRVRERELSVERALAVPDTGSRPTAFSSGSFTRLWTFGASLARWFHLRWPWRRRTKVESMRAWVGGLFRRRSKSGFLARIGSGRFRRTK